MQHNRLWVLGAADPEMTAIEALLRECGERVAYALDADDQRVTPREAYAARVSHAYAADPGRLDGGLCSARALLADVIYEVECMVADRDTLCSPLSITIDHHRPGDPGFGRPPAEFLAASSLGQVIAELARVDAYPIDGMSIPAAPGAVPGAFALVGSSWYVIVDDSAQLLGERATVAACDHCLGAAWQGQCPGVAREQVRAYRARMAASRPVDPVGYGEYQARFSATLAALEDSARIDLAPWHEGTGVAGCDWPQSRPLDTRALGHLDELPDVACYLGVAYLAAPRPRPGERAKVVVGGCTTPQMVRDFLERWAPAQGLVDCYGDPERGFAGGYAPASQGKRH